jgi:hypothetical protein
MCWPKRSVLKMGFFVVLGAGADELAPLLLPASLLLPGRTLPAVGPYGAERTEPEGRAETARGMAGWT